MKKILLFVLLLLTLVACKNGKVVPMDEEPASRTVINKLNKATVDLSALPEHDLARSERVVNNLRYKRGLH